MTTCEESVSIFLKSLLKVASSLGKACKGGKQHSSTLTDPNIPSDGRRAKHGENRFVAKSSSCIVPFNGTRSGETLPELSARPRVLYSVDIKGAAPAVDSAPTGAEIAVPLKPRVRLNRCVKMLSSCCPFPLLIDPE